MLAECYSRQKEKIYCTHTNFFGIDKDKMLHNNYTPGNDNKDTILVLDCVRVN